MGTSCTIVLRENNKRPISAFYRHYDGHPNETGEQLSCLLKASEDIYEFKALLETFKDLYQEIDVEQAGHHDDEYIYVVDNFGTKIKYMNVYKDLPEIDDMIYKSDEKDVETQKKGRQLYSEAIESFVFGNEWFGHMVESPIIKIVK